MGYLILLYHLLLLQPLDCHDLPCLLFPANSHLAESALPNDSERLKVSGGYSDPLLAERFGFLLYDFVSYFILLLLGEPEVLDLFLEHFPVLVSLLLRLHDLGVLALDVLLCSLDPGFQLGAHLHGCYNEYIILK